MYRTNAHRPPPPPRTPRAWPRVVLYSTLALVVGSVVAALLVHAVSAARSTIPTSVIPLPTPASPAPPPTPLFTETSPIGGMDTVEPPLHGVETKVYWTVPDEGLVKRVSWMGGSPEVVASAERRPTDLIAHRDAVLWVDEGVDAGQGPHGRGIKRLLPDGSLRQIVAGHVSPGTKLAINERDDLVWSDPATGEIDRATVTGGPVSVVVKGQTFPFSAEIAIDESFVYWTPGSNVMRAPLAGGAAVALASTRRPAHVVLGSDCLFYEVAAASGLGGHARSIIRLDTSSDAGSLAEARVAEEGVGGVVDVEGPLNIGGELLRRGPEHVSSDRQSVFWTDGRSVLVSTETATRRR